MDCFYTSAPSFPRMTDLGNRLTVHLAQYVGALAPIDIRLSPNSNKSVNAAVD